MIKILEIANFQKDTSPIDRNRGIISSFLDKEKFEVYSISGREKITALRNLTKYKFDIIHTRSWPICIPLRMLVKIRNTRNRHLFSVHGLPEGKSCYRAGKWLASNADVVHCVSKFTAHQVEEEYGADSVVIYNGTDTKLFKPLCHYNERIKVLFVGSYVERKKPQYILKLAKKIPNCDFVMYGSHCDSHLFKLISKEAKKLDNLSVNKTISWYELVKIYQTSDIFVLPSLHEGFVNVLIEATSCGLPVVAFNVSSLPELIIHGENGLLSDLLFKWGDESDLKALNFSEIDVNLKSLKENLQYLSEDENARKEMGEKARKSAEKFDWSVIVKIYEELYKRMVEG